MELAEYVMLGFIFLAIGVAHWYARKNKKRNEQWAAEDAQRLEKVMESIGKEVNKQRLKPGEKGWEEQHDKELKEWKENYERQRNAGGAE